MKKGKHGFTLVELLVVIAIIGVLVALLLPAVQAAREAARRATCLNQIKQLSIANLNYESTNHQFPPASGSIESSDKPSGSSFLGEYSWIVYLLPYIEQQSLYDRIDGSVPWCDPKNEIPTTTVLAAVRCPSRTPYEPVTLEGGAGYTGFGEHEDSELRTHYMGVLGANTELVSSIPYFCTDRGSVYSLEIQEGGSSRGNPPCVTGGAGVISNNGILYRFSDTKMGEITDGTSNTFLVGETAFGLPEADMTRPWIVGGRGANTEWMYTSKNLAYAINSGDRPGPLRNNIGFGSEHPGGCHFALADGSANFYSENIDLTLLFNLAARNDGQVIDSSQL